MGSCQLRDDSEVGVSVCGEGGKGGSDRRGLAAGAHNNGGGPKPEERLLRFVFTECFRVDFCFIPERQSRVVVRGTRGSCACLLFRKLRLRKDG